MRATGSCGAMATSHGVTTIEDTDGTKTIRRSARGTCQPWCARNHSS
jgi:hypothetical protein